MSGDTDSSDVADDDNDKIQYVHSCAIGHNIWFDFGAGVQEHIVVQQFR